MANIPLEFGSSAMLGKPLMIAKSKVVAAPSDLTGTNRIEYDTQDEAAFEKDKN